MHIDLWLKFGCLVCVWVGSSKRYWFAESSGWVGEEKAQAQASCSVTKFFFHGTESPIIIIISYLKWKMLLLIIY